MDDNTSTLTPSEPISNSPVEPQIKQPKPQSSNSFFLPFASLAVLLILGIVVIFANTVSKQNTANKSHAAGIGTLSTLSGTFIVQHYDNLKTKEDKYIYSLLLKTNQVVTLNLQNLSKQKLYTGMNVQISGVQLGNTLTVDMNDATSFLVMQNGKPLPLNSPQITVYPTPSIPIRGNQRLIYVEATLPSTPFYPPAAGTPIPVPTVKYEIYTKPDSVKNFFSDVSFQQMNVVAAPNPNNDQSYIWGPIALSISPVPTFTPVPPNSPTPLPQDILCSYNSFDIANSVVAQLASQVHFQIGDRLAIYFHSSCHFGMGVIGEYPMQIPGQGTITMSHAEFYLDQGDQSWIWGAAEHELGHTFGLGHSDFINCGVAPLLPSPTFGPLPSPYNPPPNICNIEGYNDPYEVMGWGGDHGLYNAPHREQLGYLQSPFTIQTVINSGTYVLHPYSSSTQDLKAIKIPRSPGSNDYVYFEFRQPIGLYDSNEPGDVYQGALVHVLDPQTSTNETLQVDTSVTTPTPPSNTSSVLQLNQTFADPDRNYCVTVTNIQPNVSLTLNVRIPCTGPTYTPVPTPSVAPGQCMPTGYACQNEADCCSYACGNDHLCH